VALLTLCRFIEFSGLLTLISVGIARIGRGCVARILVLLEMIFVPIAALFMNDTAVAISVPLGVALAKHIGIEIERIVALLAIDANVGSMLSPVGSPQNVIISTRFGIPLHVFVASMAIPTLALLALLVLYTYLLMPRRCVELPPPPPVALDRSLAIASIVCFAATLTLHLHHLSFLGLALAMSIPAILAKPRLYKLLDYELYAIFILMFLDFQTLSSILTPPPIDVAILAIALSQVVSNVPATLLLVDHAHSWLLFTVAVNLGGVPTAISSVANLVAMRLSGSKTLRFHLYTTIFFLAALPIAMAVAYAVHR